MSHDSQEPKTPKATSVIPLPGVHPTNTNEELTDALDNPLGLTPLDATPAIRPMFHRVTYPPRVSINGILVSLLCALLLILMGFVMIPLPSPLYVGASIPIQFIQYTFQLPLALMIAALLGPYLGATAIALFLLTGLAVYPVFANGGGWDYVFQPGFGYLLATLVVGSVVGRTFHKAFQKASSISRSLKILTLSVVSVALLHSIGVLYMVGLTLTGKLLLTDFSGWVYRLTLETAPYDLLATAVFFCLVRQIRLGLWLVLY